MTQQNSHKNGEANRRRRRKNYATNETKRALNNIAMHCFGIAIATVITTNKHQESRNRSIRNLRQIHKFGETGEEGDDEHRPHWTPAHCCCPVVYNSHGKPSTMPNFGIHQEGKQQPHWLAVVIISASSFTSPPITSAPCATPPHWAASSTIIQMNIASILEKWWFVFCSPIVVLEVISDVSFLW